MKKNITYPSSDGKTMIHAVMWLPEGETVSTVKPRAIVQLVHGMLEYIERYDAFAKFLTEQGFLVVGNDHLGHGQSVTSVENWGFIADATDVNSPADFMIHDMNRLYLGVHKKFPNVPYFILGHSMGSYLLRRYLAYEGDRFAGAIVMGTGDLPNSVTIPGMALVHAMAKAKGWQRDKMVRSIVARLLVIKIQRVRWGGSSINLSRALAAAPCMVWAWSITSTFHPFPTRFCWDLAVTSRMVSTLICCCLASSFSRSSS